MNVSYLSFLQFSLDCLLLVRHELLLFAAFWFAVGAIDELAIDLSWPWLRLQGRGRTIRLSNGIEDRELLARTAVLVPAWQESQVIGAMISHKLQAWRQRDFSLFIGCYRNDPGTLAAAVAAARNDPRLRIVIHGADGPTTKADCLNRLYAALCEEEVRSAVPFSSVVLQDAEDMVHPAALVAVDHALAHFDFVQLPVRPELQPASCWVAGHYACEFTEAHAKAMVVRGELGAAMPAAGVGCGFSRRALATLALTRSGTRGAGPFAADALTEDHELGLLVMQAGGRGRFLRMRDSTGALVATRSYFPSRLDTAVRQKSRWIHGIALQGWDRLGWTARPIDIWMALRDRRGPLTAVVLAAAYLLILVEGMLFGIQCAGFEVPVRVSDDIRILVIVSAVALAWRIFCRFTFTAREYGVMEGLLSVLRIPVSNVITIIAGRRALIAYLRTLRGYDAYWDKTAHDRHPAAMLARAAHP